MIASRRLAALVVAGALAISACGDDGDDTAAAGSAGNGPAAVPNPCELLNPDELAFVLGRRPGRATPSAYDPEQRRICTYGSGVIVALEIAENYDTAIEVARDESGEDSVSEVSGVGEGAVWQEVGDGSGWFMALGDEYFVGVLMPGGHQGRGQAIAALALIALAER
jgi:hypothetical protein